MKSVVLTLSMFLTIVDLTGQSVERFIRIIGNSSYTFESMGTRINFTVNETVKSEYRNTENSSFEQSLIELKQKLDSLSIKGNLIEKSNFKFDVSQKTKSKEFYIDIEKQNEVDRIIEIQNEKYLIKNFTYLYFEPNFDIEDKLANDAINDAKQKATAICLKLGKKLGDILNVETRSNGCCSYISESSNSIDQKKYSVTITFELLNK
ncbi:MAG: SIMPL domain-containing protein [Saprospiraceae bacterium]|nr:SIMPL domain-containing protein [Saprospiraceae bacterium]MBL0081936.1 SIMPL domain-containing protein [Saprospiraceae bacterium]